MIKFEFRRESIAAVVLTVLAMILAIHQTYIQVKIGPGAGFNFFLHYKSSVLSINGLPIAVISVLMAWKRLGANLIAAMATAYGLSQAIFNTTAIYKIEITILSAAAIAAVIVHFSRRFYENRPFWPLVGLAILTTALQSTIYELMVPAFPLTGSLMFKATAIIPVLGILWATREKKEIL